MTAATVRAETVSLGTRVRWEAWTGVLWQQRGGTLRIRTDDGFNSVEIYPAQLIEVLS